MFVWSVQAEPRNVKDPSAFASPPGQATFENVDMWHQAVHARVDLGRQSLLLQVCLDLDTGFSASRGAHEVERSGKDPASVMSTAEGCPAALPLLQGRCTDGHPLSAQSCV